ncbi:two component transcriptional regulator, winged helix family [Denitrovibrio acetiphilus DSM 12809]|uniref:Two component transcriptional regulator, winged helix family n=2 Tax=Denitrovibrio TaxID=117999 RepID=D4H2E5_DENA2|nr:two component transcriptional regulator, winged helix family [Denitrovibrio acetiphilus DSM 12809]
MGKSVKKQEVMRFLLVEDDLDISENIVDYLEEQGCGMDYAMSGELALELLRDNLYDAVILDINMHKMNGFEVCRHIRENMRLKIPVLMLTARVMLKDKINGFKCGADDFLTKPFDLEELFFRLKALSRRYNQCLENSFQIEDLILDQEKGIVERAGEKINLSHVCFRILLRLIERSPGIVTKEELIYDIWGDQPPMSNSLKSHFYILRQLIDKPYEKQLLHSVRGRGYKIDPDHKESYPE